MRYECIIVGAGLSGLYTAYRLEQAGVNYRVLEARERFGGRIHCATRPLPGGQVARYDLGPAWVWPQLQPLIADLAHELKVPLFPQRVHGDGLYEDMSTRGPVRLGTPSPHGDSFRIVHGAMSLVEALASRLAPDRIALGQHVVSIVEHDGCVTLQAGGGTAWEAEQVIIAMPPRLFARNVECVPGLAPALREHMLSTPTWMAGHAKLLAFYETPFWENQGLSGEAFSRIGPLTEIYDASPASKGDHALFGFFGISAEARRQLGTEMLLEHALAQLARLFGPAAKQVLDVHIKDWSADPLTATAGDAQPPSGHPAYGWPGGLPTDWNGRLIFSSTEMAAANGGYLEGALEAGLEAARRVSPFTFG
jgi:monoamine oxidase